MQDTSTTIASPEPETTKAPKKARKKARKKAAKKARKKAAKKAPKKSPKKTKSPKAKKQKAKAGRNGGMATFIRSCSRTMKAKDVVAAGAKKGFTIPERYVYSCRTAAKRKVNGRNSQVASIATLSFPRHETLEEMTTRHIREIREFVLNEALRGLR